MSNLINKNWWKAALIRALKTMCQTAVALLGTGGIGILDVDWQSILSVVLMAGICSLLTSIAGLPEVQTDVQQEAAEEIAMSEDIGGESHRDKPEPDEEV